ncbi:MAG: FAD-dependent oxidoreductase [Chloroflexi bacterium]|nr:FAD-dependent oxidoreductase [Chloroflexota bacterium]
MSQTSQQALYHFTRTLVELPPVDVLVAGGGMAGFSAAVAAARQGARVMLVEQHADLGGTATTAGTAAFCGETTGQGEVFDAVVQELERLEAIAAYKPYREREARPFDHEVLKTVLQEQALAAGVDLWLHTRVADVDCRWDRGSEGGDQKGRIEGVIVDSKSGLQAIRPATVIDCTGDGDVTHLAGFSTAKGREADGAQLPMSINFFLRHAGRPVQQDLPAAPAAPGGALRVYDSPEELPMLSVWPQGDGKIGLKLKIVGHDATDGKSLSEAEVHARRLMWSMIHYVQRHPMGRHDLSHYKFDYISPRIGIREGHRAVGEYVLTVDDVRNGRTFEDGIALGVFYLDCMDPATDKRVYQINWEARHVPPYQIPYRALIPRGAKNLLVAGRCFSADQLALSSARVMTTASMMGQAAGIAAAWSAAGRRPVGEVTPASLRRELANRGAVLEPAAGMTVVAPPSMGAAVDAAPAGARH